MTLRNISAIATVVLLVTFLLFGADKLGIIELRPPHAEVHTDTVKK